MRLLQYVWPPKKDEKQKQPQSIDELRQQLEKVLAETHTPGLAVAIVHRDRPEWVAGLGKADVASGRATTAETLFRIGSTSKGFFGGRSKETAELEKLLPDACRLLG